MASKTLMGDMPELMENILNNLNKEIYSLRSCALVSRHWCKISIPILWQNPFSFERDPSFISIYFSSFSEDEKLNLKEIGIDVKFSKPLFDYAKFIKVLDLSCLESKVEKLIREINVKKWNNHEPISSKCGSLSMYRIINLLFKLFVESGATLYELDLLNPIYEIAPDIFNLLEQNGQFFSRLQNLSLCLTSQFRINNVTTLLKILAKNTTKIRTLQLDALQLDEFYFGHEPQLIPTIVYLIKSQEQLRKFHLFEDDDRMFAKPHSIIAALEYQKQSLREIIIDKCDYYRAEFDVLMNCRNLEILRIINCDLKILKTTSLHKIKTLKTLEIIVNPVIDAPYIVEILKNSGILLQRLKLESNKGIWEESLLLKTIKPFCPNIIYLNFSPINFSTQLIELIGNLHQLQFLTLLCTRYCTFEKEFKLLIIQLAKILPLKLQYLELRGPWLNYYIYILLNNCNVPLKKLLINHLGNEENNIEALIEFCIRIKTLNYVGLGNYSYLDRNIKKEVEKYVALVPCERIIVDC